MDPVAIIVTALTAGAVTALQETAGTAVKDTYSSLVALLKKKFGNDSKSQVALEGYAEDPKTWRKPLEKAIKKTRASEDKAILEIAQKLLELIQSLKASPKFNIEIDGNVEGIVQGDNAKVTMNFNKPAPERKKKK